MDTYTIAIHEGESSNFTLTAEIPDGVEWGYNDFAAAIGTVKYENSSTVSISKPDDNTAEINVSLNFYNADSAKVEMYVHTDTDAKKITVNVSKT